MADELKRIVNEKPKKRRKVNIDTQPEIEALIAEQNLSPKAQAPFDPNQRDQEIIALEAAEEAFDVSSKESGMSRKDVDKSREILLDPIKRAANVDKIENTIDPSKSSVSDKFAAAFTAFLPQITGGLIGAAIGGSEGLVQGAELGGKLVSTHDASIRADIKLEDDLLTSDLKRKQIMLGKPSTDKGQFDITSDFVIKGTKEPVFSRRLPGKIVPEYINQKGEIVDARDLVNLKGANQEKREKRLEEQHKRNFSQGQIKEGKNTLNKFRSFNKGAIEQVRQLAMADMLVKGNQLSSDQLATFNAKVIFQEARITDEDVARARISEDLLNRIKSTPERFLTGKVSGTEAKQARELLGAILKRKSSELRHSASSFATKLDADAAGLSIKELERSLIQASELENDSSKSKGRESYNNAISNAKSIEEIEEIKKQFGAR